MSWTPLVRIVVPLLAAPLAGAQTLLVSRPGDAAGDAWGSGLAVVGDVDGDGVDDYAIGAPGSDLGGANAGLVRVYSSATGGVMHAWTGVVGSSFGASLTGLADLDGDGLAEVAVGAPGGDYVDVRSGGTGVLLYHLVGAPGRFGHCVAGGGDVDGDGVEDLLVGAPYDNLGATGGGRLYVHSGATGALVRTLTGTTCALHLGWSAAIVDDVDGDGRAEYAVGCTNDLGCAFPAVRLLDGATGAQRWSSTAPSWSDQLGYAVARLADVNGDGVDEVLAGARQDPGVGCGPCNGKGFVRLLDGASGATLWQVAGTGFYAGLGSALAALGDLDGDGVEDFAVSQPSSEGCNGSTLAVQVRSGFDGAVLAELPYHSFGDNFGLALAAGDVNGDGLGDLFVGAPCDDVTAANAGNAFAYTVVRDVTVYCAPKVNSQGCTPQISAVGTPSYSAGTFRVRATNVLNQQFGILFWGRVPTAVPFQGGLRCVKNPVVRTPVQNSGGNPLPLDCSGAYAFHFQVSYMTAAGIAVGDQVYCQFWSRDAQDPFGTGLTAGLAFHVGP